MGGHGAHGQRRINNMKVYQYIFYDNFSCDITAIQGTNLYDVNTRAYAEYCSYFGSKTKDDCGDPKQTLLEFCTWHEKHKAGCNGASFDSGYVDIIRNDFEI